MTPIFDEKHCDVMPLLELDRGYVIFASVKLREDDAGFAWIQRNACNR